MRLDSGGNTDRSIYFRNQATVGKVRSDASLQFDVGVSSSPSVAMYIEEDTRNVGIGTTDPSAELEIASSAATIRLTDSDLTNHYSEIEKAGVYTYFSSRANTSDGGFLFFGSATDTEFVRITAAGNVGIGVSSDPSNKLEVNGSISASSKTFNIEHPTQSGKRLIHGCFEGPEYGVYFRGKSQDSGIQAPEYWSGLVDIDSMTVDVTPIGANQSIYVDRIEDNGDVYVGANTEVPLNYFYIVYGERKDIDNLVIVKDAPIVSHIH